MRKMRPKEKFYKKLLHRALLALGVSAVLNVFLIAYLYFAFDEAGYFFSGEFQPEVAVQEIVVQEIAVQEVAVQEPALEKTPEKKVSQTALQQEIILPSVQKIVLQKTEHIQRHENAKQAPTKKKQELPKKIETKPTASKQVVHVVQAGESLWVISRRYKVDVEMIKKSNTLTSDSLQPGMVLKIPVK